MLRSSLHFPSIVIANNSTCLLAGLFLQLFDHQKHSWGSRFHAPAASLTSGSATCLVKNGAPFLMCFVCALRWDPHLPANGLHNAHSAFMLMYSFSWGNAWILILMDKTKNALFLSLSLSWQGCCWALLWRLPKNLWKLQVPLHRWANWKMWWPRTPTPILALNRVVFIQGKKASAKEHRNLFTTKDVCFTVLSKTLWFKEETLAKVSCF